MVTGVAVIGDDRGTEPTLLFMRAMQGIDRKLPFSEETNKACADFMHYVADFIEKATNIQGDNIVLALTHAVNPRFPYVVPGMHALSRCGIQFSHTIASVLVPFSTAWFFAFSQADKDKLIDAYVTLMDIFDPSILLPTERDRLLFVKNVTEFCKDMNSAIVSLEAQFFDYIPEHTHHTVDKTGKQASSVLVDSVGSAIKEERLKKDTIDYTEDIIKAGSRSGTTPRALCTVVHNLRTWLSKFERTVPPHGHMWRDEKNKEFASKQLIKEIRISSVIPPATGQEFTPVPIYKMRQEILEWPQRLHERPIRDHTHYILSGDTKKDVIVVGLGSNIAIGGLK